MNYSSWWEPRFSILPKVVLRNFRRMLLVHRFDGFFCFLNWFFKAFLLNWFATTKTWRTWSLALSVHNFLSHLHFFKVGEIMLLKYENLMLPAGHILDPDCVWLLNAAPFCENYTKAKIMQRFISVQNNAKH